MQMGSSMLKSRYKSPVHDSDDAVLPSIRVNESKMASMNMGSMPESSQLKRSIDFQKKY